MPSKAAGGTAPDSGASGFQGETNGAPVVTDRAGLDVLLSALLRRGYRVLGPVVRDGSIAMGQLRSTDDLPEGCHDTQEPGRYRLEHSGDPALFGWAVGQDSVKADVFPSRSVVWKARVEPGTVRLHEVVEAIPPTALVGVRPCETVALRVLDRVLGADETSDPCYRARRASFVVTAECASPSGTCFCTRWTPGRPHAGRTTSL